MSNVYAGLRGFEESDPVAARRCAERLLAMRKDLGELRRRKRDGALLLATWNIRDFDSNKFKYGPRLPETFYYIAEIIACFDLVAVQEVNEDLLPLERVMRILGREWDYIVTDITEGTSGNGERMAFVYNREKVSFRNIAGEIVLPQGQLVVSRAKAEAKPTDARAAVAGAAEAAAEASVAEAVKSGLGEVRQQFARTPFMVAFQAGWFKFNLCTVHIYYGDDSGAPLERRIDEINKLVDFFADRQIRENRAVKDQPTKMENYILLGDFNVVSPEHETMKALKRRKFKVPAAIDGDAVRQDGDHFYDQIAVRVDDPRFVVLGGGIVDMFESVFRETAEDLAVYREHMPARDPERTARSRASTPEALYKKWRTWQMSDHRPLWIEIETDFADAYLQDLATAGD